MHAPEDLQQPGHASPILGIAVGCAAYAIAHRFGRPFFAYLPELGEWSTSGSEHVIAMTYYGLIPHGLLGFVAGWAIAKVPRVSTWLGSHGARMLTVAATAAIAGALLYHVGVELTGHLDT